jgi:uncharacterized small protein (DUF1192 family)
VAVILKLSKEQRKVFAQEQKPKKSFGSVLDQAKYQMLGGWDQLGAGNTSLNSSQDLSEEELSAYIELVHEEIMRTEVELLSKQHKSERDTLVK